MKLSKLKRVHVIVIGTVVCALIGAGVFFLLIKPAKEELTKLNQRYDAAYPESMQMPQAQQALDAAIRTVNDTQEKLDGYMSAKMPVVDFTDRTTGMIQLWHEQCETMGPLLEKYASRTGVKVLNTKIPVPAPPVNPNDASFAATTIVLPLGTIQVEGSFKQVLDHIRKWNNCNRLVMIDAPKISGMSPSLHAEYNLTAFIYPMGQAGPMVQMAGGGPGAAPGAPAPAPAAPMPAPTPGAPQ
jgi:hypothetical protein